MCFLRPSSIIAYSQSTYQLTNSIHSYHCSSLHSIDMRIEIEQNSRAFPIWIEKRLPDNSSSRPYGWCVSEDLATNEESPKGLFFVKLKKTGSSTGAGVTLRIRDNLSRRLGQLNQTAPSSCFAHYNHAAARELKFQKRDPSQSFLWSIVREPAQRTLR